MYFVVFDSISLFGAANYQNVKGFETLEDARCFADEVREKGSPRVRITAEIEVDDAVSY